ncbi:putative outer membrane efflux protein MdtP [Salmonella enterica subsp. arizonae]|uniref:Putative outer membrane efflux protein MdtP n=1 Tax=Salmonella enterica subsp. arizonae TaxID=59203 RepID=A0A379T275_SALER|nr:putative outer membrane efflux protein MdtP [Salmonella enterica subsp. arizonae]
MWPINGARLQTLNDERDMQVQRVDATRYTQASAEAAFKNRDWEADYRPPKPDSLC